MKLCALALLAASLTLCSVRSTHAQQCTPSFPVETGAAMGWQGADAAYSILLPDGRDIWIFGDTLFGPERVVTGNDPRMVHNSLGISTCKEGRWQIDYVIKRDASGTATSYFSPAIKEHWYWALDGFYAKGKLWVTLLCLRHPEKPATPGFDFETCGSDLAEISDLERDPQQWKVVIHPLVADGAKAYPSATTVTYDGYAYLFAQYESGTRPLLVTRIPLSKLESTAKHLQYLARDGRWKHGLNPADAQEVMASGASELSIRYHPELKEWVAIHVDPAFFSDKILLRTAPALTGPWTDGQAIFKMPEMQPGPARNKNVFCYAGKEHPEFESSSEIVFTYVCNTIAVPELVTQKDIYIPQVIQLPRQSVGLNNPTSTSAP
jgi:hypothetical protein